MRRWRDDEERRLLAAADYGCSLEELSERFGRSRHAISKRLRKLRRGGEPMCKAREFDPAEIAILDAEYGRVLVDVIAAKLGRTRNSVIGKAYRRGLSRRRQKCLALPVYRLEAATEVRP